MLNKILSIIGLAVFAVGSIYAVKTAPETPVRTFEPATVMTMSEYENTLEFETKQLEAETKRIKAINDELDARIARKQIEAEIVSNLIENLENAGFELTKTNNGYIVEMGG